MRCKNGLYVRDDRFFKVVVLQYVLADLFFFKIPEYAFGQSSHAGGDITGQLHGNEIARKHDLVDTLRIWQFPVVLGTGKRLFGEGAIPRGFRLVGTQPNTTGAVLHIYERAGNLKYGEVEVGQETVIFDSEPSPDTIDEN